MGYIVVLGYLFAFGISDCLWVYLNKGLPTKKAMLYRSVVSVTLFLILFLLVYYNVYDFGLSINSCSYKQIGEAVVLSMVSYWGLFFFIKSLSFNGVGISVSLTTVVNTLLGSVLTVIFFNEVFTVKIILCLILVIISVFLIDSGGIKCLSKFRLSKGTIYSFLAAFFWAVSYTLFKNPIEQIGILSFSLILESTILLMGFIILFFQKKEKNIFSLTSLKDKKIIVLLGFLIFIGTLLNSASYKLLPLLTITIFAKLGLIIPILFGVIILKERPSLFQIAGIVTLLISSAILIFI